MNQYEPEGFGGIFRPIEAASKSLATSDPWPPKIMTRHPELPSGNQIWQWETPYELKVLMGESSINGGFPIAMLIARR